MQATDYTSYGRAEKPGGNGGVILRLTTAGCCYRSLAGGTKEGRKQFPEPWGQVHLVEAGATAEAAW